MQFDQGAVAAICIFLAMQTGALIFYAGYVSRSLSDHDRRLNNMEAANAAERHALQNEHQGRN
jgi:hypothetical protein